MTRQCSLRAEIFFRFNNSRSENLRPNPVGRDAGGQWILRAHQPLRDAEAVVKKLKTWDEAMIQRKSKAYDDVENFPNKFTANYLFLLNQTESDLPRVNQSTLDRLEQLGAQWTTLKSRSEELTGKDIPALNKKLWDLGFGAIWK